MMNLLLILLILLLLGLLLRIQFLLQAALKLLGILQIFFQLLDFLRSFRICRLETLFLLVQFGADGLISLLPILFFVLNGVLQKGDLVAQIQTLAFQQLELVFLKLEFFAQFVIAAAILRGQIRNFGVLFALCRQLPGFLFQLLLHAG